MIILGIDPGFGRMGCAVLKKEKGKEKLIYSDCLVSDKKLPHEKRLLLLGVKLEKIIKKYRPDIIAIEKLFLFKNQKTIMGVAEARGAVLYLAASKNIPVKEFTPLEIKMALTGYGRAEKIQVQNMVKAILKLEKRPKFDDEMDAIACAITCSSQLALSPARGYPQG